jgi:hypothetical protein
VTEGGELLHQLITIAETISPDDSVWSVFDRKLEEALPAVEVAVSVRLSHEMGNGMELVRWLEGWSLRFKQQHKTLICIAEDPLKRECLELAHPNTELIYISSLNEIPRILSRLTQPRAKVDTPPVIPAVQKNAIPENKETQQPVTGPVEQKVPLPAAGKEPSDSAIDRNGKESDRSKTVRLSVSTTGPVSGNDRAGYGSMTDVRRQVKQDAVIEVSGEYRCDHCGTTRMFCKGDVVNKCENRECPSIQASFTLQFDLF